MKMESAQTTPPDIKVPDDSLLKATGVAQPTTPSTENSSDDDDTEQNSTASETSSDESDDDTGAKEENSTMEISYDEYDEDDEDDRGTKEHKALISPSTDIRGDFAAVVEEGFGFDGAFAFASRYALGDAPNPCLVVDGYGTIGLPLGEREAPRIASEGALNGTGIWEIPAEKIRFDNPAWDTWVQKTAGAAACKALTADTSLRPTFALRKLVIHDKTCPPTTYKETVGDDKTSRKIGDLIVLLPSLFDGAQLQLSHAGQTKTIAPTKSRLATSVVAAYAGVAHALSGVTAGFRLSLVYEIVHTITDAAPVRPALPEMARAAQRLRDVLLSWKQAAPGAAAPALLACVLRHRYTAAPSFGAASLAGADALLVAHLRPLACALGFRVHLAHVTASVAASCRGCERCADCEQCEWRHDDGEVADEPEGGGGGEITLRVSQIVDLRGMPVSVDLPLRVEDYLRGPVVDGKPDDVRVEGYGYRGGATRKKLYKRTALLIWPKDSAIDGRVSVGDVHDHALHVLRTSLTRAPTKREARVVDALLECCRTARSQDDSGKKMQRAVRALARAAVRWGDVRLLLRAFKDCGVDRNAGLVGGEGLVAACAAFGWGALRDFCGEVMVHDPSNARRRALLSRLAQMGEEEGDADAAREVSAWCAAQTDALHRALGAIDVGDIPWLVDVATTRGGEFFRDVIFPQLEAQTLDRAFWRAFSTQLHRNAARAPALARMRDECVAELVRGLPAFPTKDGRWHGAKEGDSAEVLEAIKLCVETQNEALCGEIFAKMRGAARGGEFVPGFPPWRYYVELSPAVIELEAMQSAPAAGGSALDGVFRPFFVDVVDSVVSAVRTTPDGEKSEPCPLADQHTAVLAAAARKAGGISALKQSLGAAGLAAHESSRLQTLARFIAREFPRQEMSGSDVEVYDELIVDLVRAAIDTFDTATLVKPRYPYYGGVSTPCDQMMGLVQFCFEVGARDECARLLDRLAESPAGTSAGQHVSTVLAPFLPVLKHYLAAQGLDCRADPYRKFAAAVVKAFVEKVVTPEAVPAERIQALGCACADCAELRAFIAGDRASVSFPRPADLWHLENALEPMRAWGVSWARQGKKQNLRLNVTKAANTPSTRASNCEKGKTLLADLGDPATQEAILGGDYSWVHARIHATDAVPAPALVPPANAPQNSSAQNQNQNLKRPANAGLDANTEKKRRT